MSNPAVSIIMRSYNEAWALKETLPALMAQHQKSWELIVIDSGSTDGSQELIRSFRPKRFVQITPAEYNPSRVMNHGMRLSGSDVCLFLNADATPQGPDWMDLLAAGLEGEKVAACFGRQIPRPDCRAVFACDYDRCFGPGRESSNWPHFFSMVSSGLRKSVWAKRGFREDLQYAEDDEYTRWCKSQGYRVAFVQDSVVMHSHNYTRQQAWKRSHGDAKALAVAAGARPGGLNWFKTVACGFASDLRHDIKYCAKNRRLFELPHAAGVRWSQRCGKFAGLKEGAAQHGQGLK